jgi:hypothetical protein
MIKRCLNCKQEKEHHAKGLCYTCYKKLKYRPKIEKCKRCKRKMPIHAKGLCAGCYNYTFHADKNKAYSQRKTSGIDVKTFRKATQKCVVCGFDKIKIRPKTIFLCKFSPKGKDLLSFGEKCPQNR